MIAEFAYGLVYHWDVSTTFVGLFRFDCFVKVGQLVNELSICVAEDECIGRLFQGENLILSLEFIRIV